jgi:hypothetical protein
MQDAFQGRGSAAVSCGDKQALSSLFPYALGYCTGEGSVFGVEGTAELMWAHEADGMD